MHIFDQLSDYGPVYGIWSFTNERLNKLLKSYNTNNHGAGEVETSFMHAHIQDSRIRDLVLGATRSGDSFLKETASLLVQTDNDNRGTVAGMARELDEAANEGMLFLLRLYVSICFPLTFLLRFYVLSYPKSFSWVWSKREATNIPAEKAL